MINDTIYIFRFYGSCGHTENNIISEEEFNKMSAERIVKTIFGDCKDKAEVTIEENRQIVHIYPDRFFCCNKCLDEDMK